MAEPRFTVQMVGLQLFSRVLEQVGQDLSDWRPFWEQKVVPFFHSAELQEFVLEGGRSGSSWQSLSNPYAAWKRRHFPNAGILVRSGALKASLTDSDASGAVTRLAAVSMEIGTSIPYARYQQEGTSRMPARPPIKLNEDFSRVLRAEMRAHVQQVWRERRAAIVGIPSAA